MKTFSQDMSQVKAPCGHDGQVVIGTYIKCLIGCEGKVSPRKRGVVGHVDYCACKPCTIRRRCQTVLIRTKDGTDIKVPWDGIADAITFVPPVSGKLRHWTFLDADGDSMGDGLFAFSTPEAVKGQEMDLKFNWVDTLTLSVSKAVKKPPWTYEPLVMVHDEIIGNHHADALEYSLKAVSEKIMRSARLPDEYWRGLYEKLPTSAEPKLMEYAWDDARLPGELDKETRQAPIWGESPLKKALPTLRQMAKCANFGIDPGYSRPPSQLFSREYVESLVRHHMPQVRKFKIEDGAGMVRVVIEESIGLNTKIDQNSAEKLYTAVRKEAPAGVGVEVVLNTPMVRFELTLAKVNRERVLSGWKTPVCVSYIHAALSDLPDIYVRHDNEDGIYSRITVTYRGRDGLACFMMGQLTDAR